MEKDREAKIVINGKEYPTIMANSPQYKHQSALHNLSALKEHCEECLPLNKYVEMLEELEKELRELFTIWV